MARVQGQPNNKVVKGFNGFKDYRYHPTKGYRKEKDFKTEVINTPLENMIVHETSEPKNLFQYTVEALKNRRSKFND